MCPIQSDHDLGGFQFGAPPTPKNPGKSRYCYLFPTLVDDPPPAKGQKPGIFSDSHGDEEETIKRLLAIALWIEQQNSKVDQGDLSMRIDTPAAYTYFAQFVNHDLSAPVGGMLEDVSAIPNAVTIGHDELFAGKIWRGQSGDILDHFQNEHLHPLNLSSLYGEGPFGEDGQPPADECRQMYDAAGLHFKLGKTCDVTDSFSSLTDKDPAQVQRVQDAPDIPRETDPAKTPKPLIGDRRNDGNLILSQMHLALMLFHNKAVDALGQQFADPQARFAAARRLVTRHYHWCILHDFLPRILSQTVLNQIQPYGAAGPVLTEVPLEFTTAAYRFGHSMVSGSYDYNPNFGKEAMINTSAALGDLISFTTRMGMGGLGAHCAVPNHWVVDWDRLTDPNRMGLSQAEMIDTKFAKEMMDAAHMNRDGMGSIISRNLARGFHRRVPFGQVLAGACGVEVLTGDQIREVMPNKLAHDPEHGELAHEKLLIILTETPAWLYFLCEARILEGGKRLGPTASHIIAQTFIGLMRRDEQSILGAAGRSWTPAQSPLTTADRRPIATLRDLLLFAVAGP